MIKTSPRFGQLGRETDYNYVRRIILRILRHQRMCLPLSCVSSIKGTRVSGSGTKHRTCNATGSWRSPGGQVTTMCHLLGRGAL